MDEERKKAYLGWAEKGASVLNTMQVFQTFYETDQALVECEKELEKVGLGTGYTSKLATLDKLVEDRAVLYEYVWTLLDYVETKIDKPLCENFRLHATEEISRIRLDDFEVDNTLGITETVCVMRDGMPATKTKAKLTFYDFIGMAEGDPEMRGGCIAVTNGKVEEFSSIFVSQYEAYKAVGMVEEGVS
ncbi:MAG: hypothetical protein K2O16_07650 [Lachnospiraceae bacterium]|nr:hypothetical protein [Lachnospiraceae bacterium]